MVVVVVVVIEITFNSKKIYFRVAMFLSVNKATIIQFIPKMQVLDFLDKNPKQKQPTLQ